jgi:hypothetical protein
MSSKLMSSAVMSSSTRFGLKRAAAIALVLYAAACSAAAPATPVQAAPAQVAQAQARPVLRVMFVGNSLTYVNDLPRLTAALAAAQDGGPTLQTSAWAAPGGTIAERWADGHAADALRAGHWDALVLQERGGLLACTEDPEQRRTKECRSAEQAHRDFAALATAAGAKVLLFATWGPDDAWQRRLDSSIRKLAARLSGGGADVTVVPVGPTLQGWASRAKDVAVFPDSIHPGVPASLVAAALLYAAITGREAEARDMRIDFPLLAANSPVRADAPMEAQPALAEGARPLLLKAEALAPYVGMARSSK